MSRSYASGAGERITPSGPAPAFRLKHPEPTEAQVLRAVMQRLSCHPAVARIWRQNSGAGLLTRRTGGASQWIRFGFKGQPDVCGYLTDGRALFVEVKKPSGEVTPEQAEFLQSARSAGCVAFVARSVDDVNAEFRPGVTTRLSNGPSGHGRGQPVPPNEGT